LVARRLRQEELQLAGFVIVSGFSSLTAFFRRATVFNDNRDHAPFFDDRAVQSTIRSQSGRSRIGEAL
jgi:hypothetical protein